jgi:hyperosmotically inducible protein
MNSLQRKTALISLVIATALAGAACEQRSPSTVGQRMDRSPETANSAMNKPADTANSAMNKPATAVDDAAITAKVKTAIMAEPGLKAAAINVDTKDAVVTLTGTVPAPLKDRAKEIASSVNGVRSVQDNLVTQAG